MQTWRVLLLAATVAVLAGCGGEPKEERTDRPEKALPGGGKSGAAAGGAKLKIAMIPKSRVAYFNACEKGGNEAAKELGDVDFTFEGPTEDKSEEQSRLLNRFAIGRYEAITVACNDAQQIIPAIKRARDAGSRVLTYDSDADPSS